MGGHIGDRWHLRRKPKRGEPTCEHRKVPTSRHGRGRRWQAEYEAGGRMHYPTFDTEEQARNALAKALADELRGTYRDESSAKTTVRQYATDVFLPSRLSDDITRDRLASTFRVHIFPALGDRRLRELEDRPSLLDDWIASLRKSLSASSAGQVITALSMMLRRAVRDRLISTNPCDGIDRPEISHRRIDPWPADVIARVRAALPDRWQAIVDAGIGTGGRQGELLAFCSEDTDFLRRQVRIRVQVKTIRGHLHYSVLKSRKTPERTVPLAQQTGEALARHLAQFPAVPVTLPWHEPDNKRKHGKPVTRHLLFTTPAGEAIERNMFNHYWRAAVRAAGLPADPVNGCHMMRHVFASTLISRRIDPRTVAEYMGHSDGGVLVLKTYSHLMPGAADRVRQALEAALSADLEAMQNLEGMQNLKGSGML